MGQARRRGTFEERQTQSVVRRQEKWDADRRYREAGQQRVQRALTESRERLAQETRPKVLIVDDETLDSRQIQSLRNENTPVETQQRIGTIGHHTRGRGGIMAALMLTMAASFPAIHIPERRR